MSGRPVIRAVVVARLSRRAPPGALAWLPAAGEPVPGFRFACPCGCGLAGEKLFSLDVAEWDGNMLEPTIFTRIKLYLSAENDAMVEHWDGWLRAGVWERDP